MHAILRRGLFNAAIPTLIALLLTGCAKKIDWNALVGTYTYDQAVLEMGPPDKQAKLTDGTTVAEWLAYRGGSITSFTGGGYGYRPPYRPYYYGGSGVIVNDYQTYERYLRLTFAPDGSLQSFKKYTR